MNQLHLAIVTAVLSFEAAYGYPPLCQEVAVHLGSSLGGYRNANRTHVTPPKHVVLIHIRQLKHAGFLEMSPYALKTPRLVKWWNKEEKKKPCPPKKLKKRSRKSVRRSKNSSSKKTVITETAH